MYYNFINLRYAQRVAGSIKLKSDLSVPFGNLLEDGKEPTIDD